MSRALLQVLVLDDGVFGSSTHMRPMLTCGHWGPPIFEQSSQWDFPHEELICPTCSCERQMDLELQLRLNANDTIDHELVEEG